MGIIGQRIPQQDLDKCKGCKKCAIEAACPNKVAKVVDGKLHIDEEACRHCGRFVGKCPFDSIPDVTYGYKIYVGGRWGKKVAKGKSLGKIFTTKEEALEVRRWIEATEDNNAVFCQMQAGHASSVIDHSDRTEKVSP